MGRASLVVGGVIIFGPALYSVAHDPEALSQ